MVNAVRVDEEKSQSWVIAVEALILGAVAGYHIHNSGAHPALSIVLGIAATALVYFLIVYVSVIFWIWTLGLAAFSSYYIYNSLVEDTDKGWSLLWAAVVALIIIGIHAKSRLHNQVENTPNRITKLK
jgi:hypothetical protein